MKISKECGT